MSFWGFVQNSVEQLQGLSKHLCRSARPELDNFFSNGVAPPPPPQTPFKLQENQKTAQREFFQFFGVLLVRPIH